MKGEGFESFPFDFKKYVGAGNDFIIVDNLNRDLSFSQEFITLLCDRHYGIGADGLILLEPSEKGDYQMRYFNADGLSAQMCGNGLRCLVRFIFEHISQKDAYAIEVDEEIYYGKVKGRHVSLQWTKPTEIQWDKKLLLGKELVEGSFLNTGVPHFVHFYEHSLESIEVVKLGRLLRQHEDLGLNGANINFVYFDQEKGVLFIRTYERGVEDETLACGTGVVAAALAYTHLVKQEKSIIVECYSGERMEVSFEKEQQELTLTGPADEVFSARWQ
jgi:diaminopimelate epimerase